MQLTSFISRAFLFGALFLIPANFLAITPPPQTPPNIEVSGRLASENVRRGGSIQASVVMDIPSGYHVNSNRPLEKFLVATQLQIEAPAGVRVGPVSYPRAVMRSFKFSKNKMAVYEGHATMRVNVIVPANFSGNSADLKARLRFQSCNEEACFPPQTKEINLRLGIQ
jgi:DsbC/DsbD-like thiol-disulfide interchange protein